MSEKKSNNFHKSRGKVMLQSALLAIFLVILTAILGFENGILKTMIIVIPTYAYYYLFKPKNKDKQ